MDQTDQQRYLPFADEVIRMLSAGHNYDAVQQMYPELSIDDIKACHEIGMQRLNREAIAKPVYCRLDIPRK
jgi:hypothetical protein